MPRKIPTEIECEISSIGGLKGLLARLPSKGVLKSIAKHHEVLSDPIRLQIILVLKDDRLCVCVLKSLLSCPDTRLSYHLAVLRRAGIISSERERSYLRYFLTEKGKNLLNDIFELMK